MSCCGQFQVIHPGVISAYSERQSSEIKRAPGIRIDGTTSFAIPYVYLHKIIRLKMQTQTGPEEFSQRRLSVHLQSSTYVRTVAHFDPAFAFRFNMSSFSCNVSRGGSGLPSHGLESRVSNSLVRVATLLELLSTILFD